MSWKSLGPLEAFTSGAFVPVEIDGTNLVVIRGEDQVLHCFKDRCSHQDVKLSDFGAIRDGSLVCDAHGVFFDLTSGARLKGPSCGALDRYELRVESGALQVDLPAE